VPFDASRINPLALLVTALAAFLVAGLWYTALFGKLRVKLAIAANGFWRFTYE
jgi:hypothetical protein